MVLAQLENAPVGSERMASSTKLRGMTREAEVLVQSAGSKMRAQFSVVARRWHVKNSAALSRSCVDFR